MTLNYKKESGFGTVIGGFFSLINTIFFTLFIMVQLYALVFKPSYSQVTAVNYLTKDQAHKYDISMHDFLPTLTALYIDDEGIE